MIELWKSTSYKQLHYNKYSEEKPILLAEKKIGKKSREQMKNQTANSNP